MGTFARIESGVVLELLQVDGDIEGLFHPDLVWVEVPQGQSVTNGWIYCDGTFNEPPPPTAEQIKSEALSKRGQLMELAGFQIAPLQDAVDLGEATDDEIGRLKAWKAYRVQLNRIEQQPGWPSSILWPVAPTDA